MSLCSRPVGIPGETVDSIVDRGYTFMLWLTGVASIWLQDQPPGAATRPGGADCSAGAAVAAYKPGELGVGGSAGGSAAVAVATHSVRLQL